MYFYYRRIFYVGMNKTVGAILLAAVFAGAGLFSEAQAQFGDIPSIPGMPEFASVSGHYANADVGVEIDFPAGWSGNEIVVENGVVVTVNPEGAMEEAAAGGIPVTMTLSATLKEDAEPPSDPSTEESPCEVLSTGSVEVSGVQALESVAECTVTGQTVMAKTTVVNADTRWVIVSILATESDYSANEDEYDGSVATLQVEGAADIEGVEEMVEEVTEEVTEEVEEAMEGTGAMVELAAEVATVTVAGAEMQVDFNTSSTISGVTLDEESKTLSFTVEGEDGTEGMTEIGIGSVLEGPYTVAIDGEVTENFEVTTDEATGETTLTISYTHSVHEVTVSGTNVVPEFGVIAALVLAASLVAVIGVARFKGNAFSLGRF